MQGFKPGPSQIFMIVDGDDLGKGSLKDPNDFENYPDKMDNHGDRGANMSFLDGHAQFIRRQQWLRTWNISQDTQLPKARRHLKVMNSLEQRANCSCNELKSSQIKR